MTNPFGVEGLDELWRRTLGDPSVCVAVLDGPVDRAHPALESSRIECRETLAPCRAGSGPATRHGTQVASILFGRHGGPVDGIAPGCRGMILPIFAEGAGGDLLACSQVDLARAVLRAVEGGASVINISGGRPLPSGGAHPLLLDAFRLCRERGVAVASAAGNDGCDCLHLPAALPGVLAVGAFDRSGRPMDASNWGSAYRSRGILAPGDSIPAASPGGGVEPCSGTSYATAIVSGVIALLASLMPQLGRPVSALLAAATLLETARGCRPSDGPDLCRRLLAGRIDLDAAVRSLTRATPANRGGTLAASRPRRPDLDGKVAGWPPAPDHPTVGPSSAILGVVGTGARPARDQPVYPIGRLSYERTVPTAPGASRVARPLEEIDRHPWASSEIVWTLEVDSVPVYALESDGPHAPEVDRRLRRLLVEQSAEETGRLAIPGRVAGERTLPSGPRVPTIRPELRGMRPWTTPSFGPRPVAVDEFLERVASGYRNLGIAPGDRALNFCWPLAGPAFASAVGLGWELDTVRVVPHPVRAPGKDLWEVVLVFFRPDDEEPATRRTCRFTVDVVDVLPALVDGPRSWSIR